MADAPFEHFKCETMDSCLTESKTFQMEFQWTIENFLELQKANGEALISDQFPSAEGQPAYWKLVIYPKGESKENEDSVGLLLFLLSSQRTKVRAKFIFELRDIRGKTMVGPRKSDLRMFSKASNNWGFPTYVKRDCLTELLKNSKTSTLVIYCSVIILLEMSHHSVCETMDKCLTHKEKFKISYKWTIKDFLALPHVNGELLESKVFPSVNEQPAYWKLRVYPKGDIEDSEDSVSLYLHLQSSEISEVSTKCTFHAKDFNGNTVVELKSGFQAFDKVSTDFGYRVFVTRDTLTESLKRSKCDTLVIHCSIIVFFNFCNIPASSPGFSMNVTDSNLSKDLQALLLDESYSDFVINIDNRKYKVHKNILHARSPVFSAMIRDNMEEGNSSAATINDVDPEVFEKVLQFIYTEKLPMMPTDALDILPVADKYNISSLTQKCASVLKSQICTATAVKTLILADAHNLRELKEVATRYICWNADVISKTEDWSRLAASYPPLGAELFLALAVDKPVNQK